MSAHRGRPRSLAARLRRVVGPRLRLALVAYALSKVVLILIGAATVLNYADVTKQVGFAGILTDGRSWSDPDYTNPFLMWFRWDSEHYLRLVTADYLAPLGPRDLAVLADFPARAQLGTELHRFAFAPALPLLAKVLLPLTGGNAWIALLLVANIAGVACLWFVAGLAAEVYPRAGAASSALLYVVVTPVAIFLHTAASETLFLASAAGALYLARRHRWVAAGLVGALCGLTRSYGFLLAVPLVLIALEQADWLTDPRERRRTPLRLLGAVGPGLGWGAFMLYCRAMTGDAMAYPHLQRIGWGVETTSPIATLAMAFEYRSPLYMFQAFAILGLLALTVALIRLIPAPEWLFTVLLILSPLLAGWLAYRSVVRYEFGLIGLYLGLARLTAARPQWRTALVACLAALQGMIMVMWITEWTQTIV